jgi:hypothetical protein
MTRFTDPGDQPSSKGKTRKPGVKAPEPPNLFDVSDQAPPTPLRVSSPTSVDAAKETRAATMSKRRASVLLAIQSAPQGLARYQVAERLSVPEHWISSSVDALIKQRKIEESTSTIINPASGKACAVLVAIESAEESAA